MSLSCRVKERTFALSEANRKPSKMAYSPPFARRLVHSVTLLPASDGLSRFGAGRGKKANLGQLYQRGYKSFIVSSICQRKLVHHTKKNIYAGRWTLSVTDRSRHRGHVTSNSLTY